MFAVRFRSGEDVFICLKCRWSVLDDRIDQRLNLFHSACVHLFSINAMAWSVVDLIIS